MAHCDCAARPCAAVNVPKKELEGPVGAAVGEITAQLPAPPDSIELSDIPQLKISPASALFVISWY